tara:strand:- start:30 stop:296 length:267 start_codon:yes stop_codon:yes gene_type:complete
VRAGDEVANNRTIQRLEKILAKGSKNTAEILDEYQTRWPKEASGGSKIGNLLSRHKQFKKIGTEKVTADFSQYSYAVNVWKLTNERMV